MKKIIEEAKKVAKEDYEALMKKFGGFNPAYKRKWRESKPNKEGNYSFALEGTPDKAFVFVYPKRKQVVAARAEGTIIKTFDI